MSHFTSIKTQIRDIQALQAACDELKVSLLPNAKARGYANLEKPGDYVIKLNGPYDIAVNREPDGYSLTCDWWGGHVQNEVGPNYGRLLQLYGVHKAIREAKRKGCLVQRKSQQDGSIKLVISGGVA